MRFLFLVLAGSAAFSQPSTVVVHQSIFSARQVFWPELSAQAKAFPAAASGKAEASAPTKKSPTEKSPTRIGILPIRLRDYKETLPCDSCHRLSDNGMEFFLENYLEDRLQNRFPKVPVDLIAPHQSLVQSGKIDLLAYQDSLNLPWDQWFDGYSQGLIYRPKDRLTPAATIKRLDRLGGLLGVSHLLIPARVHVLVSSQASNIHTGGLEWGFSLVFWNVAEGRPEWALDYSEKIPLMDLDQSLEGNLDRVLKPAWDKMPEEVVALWKSEPR